MPVYYRGPCARITDEVIETWCPTHQAYAIHDLRDVWIERMGEPAAGPIGVGSASTAGAIAVILALERSTGSHAFDSPLALLAALAIFVASVVVAWACWRSRGVDQRLMGVYRGREVIIYQDVDPQRFAQVARALNRALERAEDSR
jgi:hypothetical protein